MNITNQEVLDIKDRLSKADDSEKINIIKNILDNDYNLSIYREILLEYKEILLLIKEKSMAEIREISKSSGIIW